MQQEIEKIKKRLIKKSEKNRVPYYHELAKFKIKIDKDIEKLRIKYKKLQEENQIHEVLLTEYKKVNNAPSRD